MLQPKRSPPPPPPIAMAVWLWMDIAFLGFQAFVKLNTHFVAVVATGTWHYLSHFRCVAKSSLQGIGVVALEPLGWGGIMWCTYLHIFAHILHIFCTYFSMVP